MGVTPLPVRRVLEASIFVQAFRVHASSKVLRVQSTVHFAHEKHRLQVTVRGGELDEALAIFARVDLLLASHARPIPKAAVPREGLAEPREHRTSLHAHWSIVPRSGELGPVHHAGW